MENKNKEGLEMKYFVLNPKKDDAYGEASRKAVKAYASSVSVENPKLAKEMLLWIIEVEDEIIKDRSGI